MADTIFDDIGELVARRTPFVTVEAARKRRRLARRLIIEPFTPPKATTTQAGQQQAPSGSQTSGSDGGGTDPLIRLDGNQNSIFEGLNPLDVLNVATFSRNPTIQAGGFAAGLLPLPFSSTIGGIAALGSVLSKRGATVDVPFTNRALIGLGDRQATTISELRPGDTSTVGGPVGTTELRPGETIGGGQRDTTGFLDVDPGGFGSGGPVDTGATGEIAPGGFAPGRSGFTDLGPVDTGPTENVSPGGSSSRSSSGNASGQSDPNSFSF